jgi:hypothetical protein
MCAFLPYQVSIGKGSSVERTHSELAFDGRSWRVSSVPRPVGNASFGPNSGNRDLMALRQQPFLHGTGALWHLPVSQLETRRYLPSDEAGRTSCCAFRTTRKRDSTARG